MPLLALSCLTLRLWRVDLVISLASLVTVLHVMAIFHVRALIALGPIPLLHLHEVGDEFA